MKTKMWLLYAYEISNAIHLPQKNHESFNKTLSWHTYSGNYRPTSKTPFESCLAGEPIRPACTVV